MATHAGGTLARWSSDAISSEAEALLAFTSTTKASQLFPDKVLGVAVQLIQKRSNNVDNNILLVVCWATRAVKAIRTLMMMVMVASAFCCKTCGGRCGCGG